MTIYGIDISHHQAGIDLQRVKNEGFQFVIARVGQGRGGAYGTTRDREWIRHRDEARRVGLRLCAYWYIGNGLSPLENVRQCLEWMQDNRIPVALDCEHGSGNIEFFKSVLYYFRQAGIRVPLSYIPKWYWQQVGSPSLAGLPPLWSSRYVVGTGTASQLYPGDSSAHWNGYGNNSISITQFTSSAKVAGYTVDANAFKGSLIDLDNLLFGTPPVIPPQPPVEVEMQLTDIVGYKSNGQPVTVKEALFKQYTTDVADIVAQVNQKCQDILDALPVELRTQFKDQFAKISDLLYEIDGQPTWEEVANTWDDLTPKTWAQLGA